MGHIWEKEAPSCGGGFGGGKSPSFALFVSSAGTG